MTVGLLLGIIFIILKATGIIDWSWVWVVSPIWIEVAFYTAVIVVAFVIGCVVAFVVGCVYAIYKALK